MKNISSSIKLYNFIFLIFTALLVSGCPSPNELDFSDHMISLEPSTGSLEPNFSTLVLHYRLIVSAEADTLTLTPTLVGENVSVSVNDVFVESGSASQAIDLNSINGVIKVDVFSDSFDYNYEITIVRGTSANAYLSDLSLSQGQLTPVFEENAVSSSGYNVIVPYLSSSINLTATLADSSASLTVNGVAQPSGELSPDISLAEGDNAIEILVTAENQVMTQTYQLSVTRRAAEDFAFSTYVKATNTDAGDEFGKSVAMWGNTLVVGAPDEDSAATGIDGTQSDNSASRRGAAYIYEKDIHSHWSFKSYLKSNENNTFSFGNSVAISDDFMIIVGYSGGRGILHVYHKDSLNNWIFVYVIESPNIDNPIFSFGRSIALSNKTLVVGTPDENTYSGAVYVYQLGNIELINPQPIQLQASNADSGDGFGTSVALSGNTLVVGARYEDSNSTGVDGNQLDNSKSSSGAAYIFTFNNEAGWSQQAYIKASNTGLFDGFGSSVSLSGDNLIVGASEQGGQGGDNTGPGAAYIFNRDASGSWSQQAYLKPHNQENGTRFSFSPYISGHTVVVGSFFENSDNIGLDGAEENESTKEKSGAAYLFIKDDLDQWHQQHYIKSPNSDAFDYFSNAISGYGDTLVLSANGENSSALFNEGGESDNSASQAGAAYIYHNAPFSNHNLALSVIKGGSSNDHITATNLDTGDSLNDCTNNCNQLVTRGETVQLTPVIGDGSSIFVEWQGELACRVEPDINGTITVTILAETFCTAVFAEVDVQLTIAKNASSTADGLIQATSNNVVIANCEIGCESDTSEILPLSSEVEIIATAEDGAFVAGWSGDAQCQANATNLGTVTTVTMSSSKTCTALFSFPETNELRVTIDAAGSSTGLVSAVNTSTSTNLDDCSSDCSTQITQGHSVQLTPVAGDGLSEFLNWSGDVECASNANGAGVTTVTLDTHTYCVAEFGEIEIEDIILTISKDRDATADGLIQGTIDNVLTASCDIGCNSIDSAPLVAASEVNFTATPQNGAVVTAWSGDAQCQANANSDNTTTNITMTNSKTCTARFDLIETHELRLIVANSFDNTGSISAFNVDTSLALGDCSNDCSQQVVSGQTVKLSPLANDSTEFSHWSGDTACSENVSTEGVSDILLDADVSCTANYIEKVTAGLTLTLSKTTGNTSLDGNMSAVPRFTDQQAIVTCDIGCTSATSVPQASGSEFDIFTNPEFSFASVVEWTGDPQCAANASADKTSTWVVITTHAITCTVWITAPQ